MIGMNFLIRGVGALPVSLGLGSSLSTEYRSRGWYFEDG